MSRCRCGKVEVTLGLGQVMRDDSVHGVTACIQWPEVATNRVPATELTVMSARDGTVVLSLPDRHLSLREGDRLTIYPSAYSITYGEG